MDLVGKRFGGLIVVAKAPSRARGSVVWKCQCECGKRLEVYERNLRGGRSKSCGCARKYFKGRKSFAFKHGRIFTKEYYAWDNMKKRCYVRKHPKYSYYGARGIKVCSRWRKSFKNFYADMGPKPRPSLTLDRRNNDGDYEPENCRWATMKQQARNRRPKGTAK